MLSVTIIIAVAYMKTKFMIKKQNFDFFGQRNHAAEPIWGF